MESPPEANQLEGLLEELDAVESKSALAACLAACKILGEQLAATREIAETWSARAVHAEAELARARTIELVDALRPGSDEFSD
jgi:hypothetical protein